MSAFLVSNKTMSRAVTAIWIAENHDLSDHANMTMLGRELFALNIAALNARYGRGNDHGGDAASYVYTAPRMTRTRRRHQTTDYSFEQAVQFFKSLQCLVYQCAEGDIPEKSELYKRANLAELKLANVALHMTPEYDNAEWG